ncbi:hypothetical protein, partial [Alistipes putredinis]|uniref:hypothetical protein n=1 Tax=Alistipes putredinis TaxID=28117 RepID=UPI003AB2EB64
MKTTDFFGGFFISKRFSNSFPKIISYRYFLYRYIIFSIILFANPYTWGMMPVPAHVAVMEALREAGGNDALIEEMKLWLLKQKQTTS